MKYLLINLKCGPWFRVRCDKYSVEYNDVSGYTYLSFYNHDCLVTQVRTEFVEEVKKLHVFHDDEVIFRNGGLV